MKTKQYIIIFW